MMQSATSSTLAPSPSASSCSASTPDGSPVRAASFRPSSSALTARWNDASCARWYRSHGELVAPSGSNARSAAAARAGSSWLTRRSASRSRSGPSSSAISARSPASPSLPPRRHRGVGDVGDRLALGGREEDVADVGHHAPLGLVRRPARDPACRGAPGRTGPRTRPPRAASLSGQTPSSRVNSSQSAQRQPAAASPSSRRLEPLERPISQRHPAAV